MLSFNEIKKNLKKDFTGLKKIKIALLSPIGFRTVRFLKLTGCSRWPANGHVIRIMCTTTQATSGSVSAGIRRRLATCRSMSFYDASRRRGRSFFCATCKKIPNTPSCSTPAWTRSLRYLGETSVKSSSFATRSSSSTRPTGSAPTISTANAAGCITSKATKRSAFSNQRIAMFCRSGRLKSTGQWTTMRRPTGRNTKAAPP